MKSVRYLELHRNDTFDLNKINNNRIADKSWQVTRAECFYLGLLSCPVDPVTEETADVEHSLGQPEEDNGEEEITGLGHHDSEEEEVLLYSFTVVLISVDVGVYPYIQPPREDIFVLNAINI